VIAHFDGYRVLEGDKTIWLKHYNVNLKLKFKGDCAGGYSEFSRTGS
jgi:hypothetical protein